MLIFGNWQALYFRVRTLNGPARLIPLGKFQFARMGPRARNVRADWVESYEANGFYPVRANHLRTILAIGSIGLILAHSRSASPSANSNLPIPELELQTTGQARCTPPS